MRLLTAELYKLLAYRWPALLLLGTLAACALLDTYLALAYSPDAASYVRQALAFNELVCRLAWFVLPVLVLAGDTHDGSLATVVLVRPAPRAVLAAKLGAALIAAQAGAVCVLAMVATLMPLGGWPEATTALAAGTGAALRLLMLPPLAVCLGLAATVLAGLRHLPWVAMGLVAWTQVVEKVLFTVVGNIGTPVLGAVLSPYNTAVVWLYGGWGSMGLPALDTWGLLPLLALALLAGTAAAVLVCRTADPAGRPWGLRTVPLSSTPSSAPGTAPSTTAATGTTATSPAGGAGAAGTTGPRATPRPAHPAPAQPGGRPEPTRGGLLADTLTWLHASLRSPGALRQAVVLVLLTAATNAAGTLALAPILEVSVTPSGAFTDVSAAQGSVTGIWGMLCLVLTVLAGSWCYLRLTHSRELAVVYTALPRRSAVVTATATHAALLAALASLASVGAGLAVLAATTDPQAVLTPPLVRLLATAPLACALTQLVVIAAAVLIRRPIPALAGAAAWLLLAEPLLDSVPGIGKWASNHSLTALASSVATPDDPGNPLTAASATAWLLALAGLTLAAAVTVERRRPAVVAA